MKDKYQIIADALREQTRLIDKLELAVFEKEAELIEQREELNRMITSFYILAGE